jgi:hypothetical protein
VIRRIACFVAACDDCHTTYDDDGQGFNVHFDSDHQALDHLAANSWTVTEDGHIRCPGCTARDFCASLNHLWDTWRVCECRGAIPAHHANGCGLVRTCAQCGAIDITTLAHLPTTGQHHRRGR